MEQVIESVLTKARTRLSEELTLDDLAEMARFSKFHFARVFRQVTGTSPRRFLFAMRLQEAKRLLVRTSLGIAAVSNRVGYHSVGTFTTRFTASVGVSPSVYRKLGGDVLPLLRMGKPDPTARGTVRGRVEMPLPPFATPGGQGGAAGYPGTVSVGLFRDRTPRGLPVRGDVLDRGGEWSLRHVPTGQWYVLAVWQARMVGDHGRQAQILVSIAGPVRVGPNEPVADMTVWLRPMRPVDPPLVVGLVEPPG